MNCKNCEHLKCVLPKMRKKLKSSKNIFKVNLGLDKKITAYCSEGCLLNQHGEIKMFKDVLRKNGPQIKSFERARVCEYYASMDDVLFT